MGNRTVEVTWVQVLTGLLVGLAAALAVAWDAVRLRRQGVRVSPVLWGLAVFAVVIALSYLVAAIRFARRREDDTARTLLRASLLYLPAQCAALLAAKFV